MNIIITDEAFQWFREEMDAAAGDDVKFFARYGGWSPLHAGFSLGIRKEPADEAAVAVDREGIRFYVEQRDEWFFDGHDLLVEIDPNSQELVFNYELPHS